MSLGVRRASSPGVRRLGPAVTLLVTVSALLAGCSGDEDAITTPTSTAPPQQYSTTTAATAPLSAEIIDRYKQFWEIRFEANRQPVNPADPRLGQYATGQQLENVVTETRQRRDQGLAIRRPEPSVYVRRVKLVRVDGDIATLQDCVTNDGIVYRAATGQVVDDKVVTRSLAATMRRVEGTWKLAETRVLQEWEGVEGCARSSDFS